MTIFCTSSPLAPALAAAGRLALLLTLGAACRKDPRVRAGDTVLLRYELSVDRKTVESNFDRKPAEVIQGAGVLPPGVDTALLGMSPGEEKSLMLLAEQAFGVRDPSRVETLHRGRPGGAGFQPSPRGQVRLLPHPGRLDPALTADA